MEIFDFLSLTGLNFTPMNGIQAPTNQKSPANDTPWQNEKLARAPKQAEAKTPSPQTKISVAMGGLLIATALFFDGGQFVLEALTGLTAVLLPLGIALSWAIDAIAWLTFFLWFHSLGLGTIKKGGPGETTLNQAPFVIIAFALGIEIIPFVNMLPAWTAAIVIVIVKERVLALAQQKNK
ncbi:MAG: hypothetical protein Q7R91_01625 [bacterium]|nr:hypothetical protein [bacterium]